MGKAIIPLAIIGGGIGLAAATGGLSLGASAAAAGAGGAAAGGGGISSLVAGAGLQGAMLAGGEVGAGVATGGGIFSSFMAALPSASTFKTIFSVGSGIAQMASGFAGNAAAKDQARMAEYNSRQELLRGMTEENAIREQANKLQSSNTARVAASGISLGGGVESQVNEAIAADAETQLGISRANTSAARSGWAMQASVLRRRGSAGLLSGMVTGLGTAGSAFL